MDMEVNNPNPVTNASRTVHIILDALQANGNKAHKTTMFLKCASSFLLRLVPDVGLSNCRSTPRVHIESRVPHLARSGAMFATIGHLGFHARTANVRTAPSSRNASPTGRPVTLLCTALMPPSSLYHDILAHAPYVLLRQASVHLLCYDLTISSTHKRSKFVEHRLIHKRTTIVHLLPLRSSAAPTRCNC